MKRIASYIHRRHGYPPSMPDEAKLINVRVYLAGFMMSFHASHVFEDVDDTLAKNVRDCAIPLLHSFQKIVACVVRDGSFARVPPEFTEGFFPMIVDYFHHFKLWKVPDEIKLTARIKIGLTGLYSAYHHVVGDGEQNARLRVEFDTQIDRLRQKMRQISGAQALARFDEENKELILFRRNNINGAAGGRAAAGAGPSSSYSAGAGCRAAAAAASRAASRAASGAASGAASAAASGAASGAASAAASAAASGAASGAASAAVAGNKRPREPASSGSSLRVTNDQIAYELYYDPGYQLGQVVEPHEKAAENIRLIFQQVTHFACLCAVCAPPQPMTLVPLAVLLGQPRARSHHEAAGVLPRDARPHRSPRRPA